MVGSEEIVNRLNKMSWNNKYLTDLEKIKKLLEENSVNAAVEFSNYIKSIDIGPYSKTTWNRSWIKAVYSFGEQFKNKDASDFINIINEYLKQKDLKNVEAVEFIFSEILWNWYEQSSEYISKLLKDLRKKYPTNPEFHNTYALYLWKHGNYSLSIDEFYLAYKIDPIFESDYFNQCKKYLDILLEKGKINEAEIVLSKMRKVIHNSEKQFVFNNILISLADRIRDHKVINKRIENIGEIAHKVIEKERGRLIEIIGFFVAILGFVFININFAINALNFKETVLLMAGMAIILSSFAVIISILFSGIRNEFQPRYFYKDRRLVTLIILIAFFILYLYIVK